MKSDHSLVYGVIGNVTSFVLFALPLPAIRRIWKNNSVEEFKYLPLAVSMIYCIMWVFYSTMPFLYPDRIPLTTINSVGFVLYMTYSVIYFIKCSKTVKMSMVQHYVALFVFLAGFMWSALVTFNNNVRPSYVGIFCDIFGIILYTLELGITIKIIGTKSVKLRLLLYPLVCFLNGVLWSWYALTKFDLFILINSVLGALIGFIQLLLYIGYYCVQICKPIKLSPVDDC